MNMSTETSTKSPIADDLSQMAVAMSLPCARCGYDLRSLAADTDCPECGEPVRLTVIETIDPASKRLDPIQKPKLVGNAILGVVASYFVSILLAVTTLLVHAPNSLPIPQFVRNLPTTGILWGAAACGLLTILFLIPLIRMCQLKELAGCRTGVMLTMTGILLWSLSMVLIDFLLIRDVQPAVYFGLKYSSFSMLFDTCFPVVSAGLVFSGFRKLVPRLGQRSRAFRQAQGSRQRMSDLLAALVVIIVGRTVIMNSPADSNLSILGLIIMVMSVSLIVIGLGYLLRNTIWIRRALVTPPPALTELLNPISEQQNA